jgi:transcriptional regulator with XRE-family HTH domain
MPQEGNGVVALSYPEQIRKARLEAGLTQERVARALGYEGVKARASICHYESGRTPISERQARRILDTIAELSFGGHQAGEAE